MPDWKSNATPAPARRFSTERLGRPVLMLTASCLAAVFWSLLLVTILGLSGSEVSLLAAAAFGVGIAVLVFAGLAIGASGGSKA